MNKKGEIDDLIDVVCPTCREKTILKYRGNQEYFPPRKYSIPLYNCTKCKSTVSLNAIKKTIKKFLK